MNIVIIDCFDTWEHRVDLLTKTFLEDGHRVTVLMSDYRHINKVRRNEKKEKFIFFTAEPYKKNMSFKRLHSHIQLSKDIFQWVEDHEKDIDILWVLAPPNCFVDDASKMKKHYHHMKLIIDLIDLWPETMPVGKLKELPVFNMWREIRDYGLKSADIVVTECDLYRYVLAKQLNGVKTETLYLAREDTGYAPELNLPEDKIALCYLGSINNIIDIDTIKRIIMQCQKYKPVLLHIVGDGERKQELINVAENVGAEVVDHGVVYNRSEKKKIFDSCHYGLNIMKKSVCVGLTMKSIDYFEFGMPIINNIKGDTWQIIEKFKCGINIGDKMIQLSVNANNKERKSSRAFFERYLTETVFKDKVRNIIKEASANNKNEGCPVRKSNYEIGEILGNGVTFFLNRFQYPTARLIRYPITVRGRAYIDWGRNLTTGRNCRIEVNGKHSAKVLIFGKDVNIGDNVSIRCAKKISIGDHVLIGSKVLIIDNAHGKYNGEGQNSPYSVPNNRILQTSAIRIDNNVWIGEGSVIQMGVSIGEGSIVAANSVLTKSIPSGVIVGGVPAIILKRWDKKKDQWMRIE